MLTNAVACLLSPHAMQLRVPSSRKAKVSCPNPVSTPIPAEGFIAYGPEQRPLGALPTFASNRRRRLKVTLTGEPLVDCYRQCYYDEELEIPFYFGVVDGVCYCSQGDE